MLSPAFPTDRPSLRRELRKRRRSLSQHQQKEAARSLARRLATLPLLQKSRRIALYWPVDGEIDPRHLKQLRHFSRHELFLPMLQAFPASTLKFSRWHAGKALAKNRFGIPEPRGRARLSAHAMDAILLPLTGFDAEGNRLGMGGGFYDRTLSFKRHAKHHRPFLVGVAHACQQVEALPVAEWDIGLDMIVTDKKIFRV